MGFDAPRSLGPREYGAHTALPIWLRYLQDALQSVPVSTPAPPADVATIDGELYETAHVPGNGFVPAIGATPPDLADTATPRGTSPPAPASASEAAISADERARILGYFDSP
ncbi:hypothetical protein [Burkholderia ubonensis]|uniref:hypothetical protein n=1 Tax=Burkholderia ubonensis TaxID=101571 RepID=UPI00075CEDF6|nr:hypothetical protein [Burkholderia ubonensis]